MRTSSFVGLGLVAVTGAGILPSCNSILGIEEATVDPTFGQDQNLGGSGTGGVAATGGDGSGGLGGLGGTGSGALGGQGGMDPVGIEIGAPCDDPGEVLCVARAAVGRVFCDPKTNSWQSEEPCEDGTLCVGEGDAWGECHDIVPQCEGLHPGDSVCDGAERVTCGPDLVTVERNTCSSAAHCAEGSGPECAECVTDEWSCDGADLRRCQNGSWTVEDTCTSADLCNAGAKQCTADVCVANQKRCVGDTLEVCNEARDGFEKLVDCDEGLCDEIQQECDICSAGEKECADDTSRTCSDDGQEWIDAACPNERPFCTGAGVCVECNSVSDCDGAPECYRDICSNKTCGEQVLSAGASCDSGAGVCDGAGSCGECIPGESKCESGDAFQCTDGKWSREACSGSTPRCSDGQCLPPPSCTDLANRCGATSNRSCCEAVHIPAGTYQMGRATTNASQDYNGGNGGADEQPPHSAIISGFHLDKYEVTVGRFRKYLASSPSEPAAGAGANPSVAGTGWDPAWPFPTEIEKSLENCAGSTPTFTWTSTAGSNEELPVNCVNWYVAMAFCAWDGGWLPTEAEWEKAASGNGAELLYPWGDAAPTSGNVAADCWHGGSAGTCTLSDIAVVGELSSGATPQGVSDMAGNVAEWVFDRYSSTWYTDQGSCNDCVSNGDALSSRVVRGGHFADESLANLRAADRVSRSPDSPATLVGFRCARPE